MKKNLFLLFSIYFFVIQPLIIGILRGQANFFRLGGINLIAIILIGLLYNTIDGSEELKKEHKEHEPTPVKEAKVSFHDHFHAAIKERNKKSELWFPAIISFLLTIILFSIFVWDTNSKVVILVFSLVIGFIVFIVLTLLFKHRITKKFRALIGTKIYLILLVISLGLTAYDYYQVHQNYSASFQDYLAQNFLGQETIPTDGYIFTGEGTVLWTGMWDTTMEEAWSTDVFTGMNEVVDAQEETGQVVWTSTNSEQLTTNNVTATIGKQKIMDAVIHLVNKYTIPLVTTPNVSFTYVTTKNPYYAERRTAYANKLIGKTTNPSKYIVCESYIVMKWLLEWRDVSYTPSTVLTNFRAEAVRRDALNGCEKGKIVTDKTL